MCGIFGIVTQNPLRKLELRRFAIHLGAASEARGKDAGGFCGYSSDEILTDKYRGRIRDLLTRSSAWKSLMYKDSYSMIGHTRNSTSGWPSVNQNNHPFHSDKYALVHNGVVQNHEDHGQRIGAKLKTKCDSEVLLHFVHSTEHLRNSVKKIYREIGKDAAFAVAVLDKENGNIYLFRSMSVPLYYGFVPRWNAWVFASTMEIIESAVTYSLFLDKNHPVVKEILDGFKYTDDGRLYTLRANMSTVSSKIWNSSADDLYKVLGEKRALKHAIVTNGVITKEIVKILKRRKVVDTKDMSQHDVEIYNRVRDYSIDVRMRFWSNTTPEAVRTMTNGEYKAYMEFVDV